MNALTAHALSDDECRQIWNAANGEYFGSQPAVVKMIAEYDRLRPHSTLVAKTPDWLSETLNKHLKISSATFVGSTMQVSAYVDAEAVWSELRARLSTGKNV